MKKWLGLAAAFSAGLSFAATGSSLAWAASQQSGEAPAQVPNFEDMSQDDLVRTLRSSGRRWIEEPCTFGEPLFTQLAARSPDNIAAERSLLFSQVFCSDERKAYAEGAEALAKLQAANPELDLLELALYFDGRMKDVDAALTRLRSLNFDTASGLSEDRFWSVARMIGREGRSDDLDDLALEWSQNGLFGALGRDMQSSLAFRAFGAAARQEKTDLTDELLSYITTPNSYITLLTKRKYEQMWPEIEQRAGPNLADVGAENVALTEARLGNNKDDRDRFSAAAHALHFDGRFEEAVALADQWRKREGRGAAIEEGDGWALNIQAYAYDSLGQPEKADAIFDELAQVNADDNPWVVNFVINRASRLVGHGRWDTGLEAASLARGVAENYGSTYAKMIVAKDHACALRQLSRSDEAAGELAYLRENSSEGLSLTVQALMCHDLDDEAAVLLMAALADPIDRDTAIAAFETGKLDLFYTQSILPNASDLLANYPELAAELAKYVRAMPDEYVPQASLKRKALDLPDWK